MPEPIPAPEVKHLWAELEADGPQVAAVEGEQDVPLMRVGVVDAFDHDLEDVRTEELPSQVGGFIRR